MKLEQLFQHRSNKKAFRRNNLFSMLQQLFYFRADSYYFLSELWYPCQPARFSQKKKEKKPAREFPGSRRTCHRRSGWPCCGVAADMEETVDRRPAPASSHRPDDPATVSPDEQEQEVTLPAGAVQGGETTIAA